MKNIFIEGIQGTGKTTLTGSLARAVPEYHVCREGDYSPVDLAWCAWMTEEEYEAVLKRYEPVRDEIRKNTVREGAHYVVAYTKIITDIPNFHRELEKYEVYNGRKSLAELRELVISRYRNFKEAGYLFECSFFQNIVEDLMLFHLCDDREIVEFYRELYYHIDKKRFQLLYLYSDNLEETIRVIRKNRSDDSGNELWYEMMLRYLTDSPYGVRHGYRTFADMITHFQHRQRLEMRIIEEIIGDNAMILPSKEWRTDGIISRLSL